MQQYYNVLEIQEGASLAELKKAFRMRSKELHPDFNKAANAHEKFILLVEAYEYLLNKKSNKTYDSVSGAYTSNPTLFYL